MNNSKLIKKCDQNIQAFQNAINDINTLKNHLIKGEQSAYEILANYKQLPPDSKNKSIMANQSFTRRLLDQVNDIKPQLHPKSKIALELETLNWEDLPYPINIFYQLFETEDNMPLDFESNLNHIIEKFSSREQYLIDSRYKNDMTLDELAESLHISKERVRQIQKRCLIKIKKEVEQSDYHLSPTQRELNQIDKKQQELQTHYNYKFAESKFNQDKVLNQKNILEQLKHKKIKDLQLDFRSENGLKKNNIHSILDLLNKINTDKILNSEDEVIYLSSELLKDNKDQITQYLQKKLSAIGYKSAESIYQSLYAYVSNAEKSDLTKVRNKHETITKKQYDLIKTISQFKPRDETIQVFYHNIRLNPVLLDQLISVDIDSFEKFEHLFKLADNKPDKQLTYSK